MRIIDQFSIEEIEKIVQESTNLAQVARKLGYTGHSGKTSDLLKRFFKEHNIDYSHFTGQPSHKVKRTFENTFVVDSTVDQSTLRKKFLEGKYVPYKCSICNISEWNNKPLTLRLDHINGKNHDNRLENLRWLCPNCDSQSEFYCGRNR